MVNDFSWEQFPAAAEPEQEEDEKAAKTSDLFKEEYNWGDFRTPTSYQEQTQESEDLEEAVLRIGFSNIARATETAAGRRGDIYNFAQETIRNNPKAGGLLGYVTHELMGEENWDKMFQKDPETLGIQPPTSEEFRDWTKETFDGRLEPKGKVERRLNEMTQDVTAILAGRGKPSRDTRSLYNYLGIPAAANIVKGTVEDLGFGEEYGNYAKIGTMLGLGLMNNVNARSYATDRVYQGRNAFSSSVKGDPERLKSEVQRIRRLYRPADPRSSAAIQQLDAIEKDLESGAYTMPDLMNRFDAINAVKQDRGMFDLPSKQRKIAIKNLDRVKAMIGDEIEMVGNDANPEAYNNWNEGMKALSVINESEAISNTAQKFFGGRYAKGLSGPLGALFGAGSYATYKSPAISGGTAALGTAAYKVGQVGYRVFNDKNLARYYWQAVSEAHKGNEQAFINTYKRLERAYEKKYGKKELEKEKKSIKSLV